MINIKNLANEIGLTRQNLNYHILRGRGGSYTKGSNHTSQLELVEQNAITLIQWLLVHGRQVDTIRLMELEARYANTSN